MSRGGIKKTYIAAAVGAVYQSGTVIANIKRRYESIIERTVCPENEGQYAETRYAPLYTDGKVTLLEVRPSPAGRIRYGYTWHISDIRCAGTRFTGRNRS